MQYCRLFVVVKIVFTPVERRIRRKILTNRKHNIAISHKLDSSLHGVIVRKEIGRAT